MFSKGLLFAVLAFSAIPDVRANPPRNYPDRRPAPRGGNYPDWEREQEHYPDWETGPGFEDYPYPELRPEEGPEPWDDDGPREDKNMLPTKLVDGATPLEGRVEVQVEGTWGTVCNHKMTAREAQVICNSLGHFGRAELLTQHNFGMGTGSIHLDGVTCEKGRARNLGQCCHNEFGVTDCTHQQDVAVRCSDDTACVVQALRQTLPGAFVPTCDPMGLYGPTQCQGSECWCSDPEGNELPRSRHRVGERRCREPGPPRRDAPCLQQAQPSPSERIRSPLQCDRDGNFKAKQCESSSGDCWCVNVTTGVEDQGTRKRRGEGEVICEEESGEETDPSDACDQDQRCPFGFICRPGRCFMAGLCQPQTCVPSDQRPPPDPQPQPGRCEMAVRQVTALALGAMDGIYVPQCDRQGNYVLKQCRSSTGSCWCVEPQTGTELRGTRKAAGLGEVICDDRRPVPVPPRPSGPCVTAVQQMRAQNPDIMPGRFVPQCDRQGNYAQRQCSGSSGYCWCTDPETGTEIEGTMKAPGNGEVICDDRRPVPVPPRPSGQCVIAVQQMRAQNSGPMPPGRFVPRCDQQGNYAQRQCSGSSGYCWCVDTETGTDIEGTMKAPGNGEVICDDRRPPRCVIAVQQMMAQNSHPMVGRFVPQCDEQGNYAQRQCDESTSYCWCAEPESGQELPGTKKRQWEEEVICDGVPGVPGGPAVIDVCRNHGCPTGQYCSPLQVQCIRAPCPISPTCIDDRTSIPQCNGGQQWSECGSACSRTCDDPSPVCNEMCTPAKCQCPSHMPILHRGICISQSECPSTPARNACDDAPCLNGGRCNSNQNGYVCECLSGFSGTNCQFLADACGSTPCRNRGSCSGNEFGYRCQCQPGFSGTNCERDNRRQCSGGQEWRDCGSACTSTCDNPSPTCVAMCTPAKCQCPSHMPIFHRGRCISQRDCPSRPGNRPQQATVPTPRPDDPQGSYQVLYECTFEHGLCGMMNSSADNIDWRQHSGDTRTWRTGPNVDHTQKTPAGHYVYMEGNDGRVGNVAILDSPKIARPGSMVCLQFWVHMAGSQMGSLVVKSAGTELFNFEGKLQNSEDDEWIKKSKAFYPADSSFSVSFIATRGDQCHDYLCDIAIDDVSITQGACP